MVISISHEVDIGIGHFMGSKSVQRFGQRRNHANPNPILCGNGLVIVVGFHAVERQITGSISEFLADGRYAEPTAGEGGYRLRMRLSEKEILLLHDGSQDGRPLRLWNRRRPANEGGFEQ
jgi:hypothetical protein